MKTISILMNKFYDRIIPITAAFLILLGAVWLYAGYGDWLANELTRYKISYYKYSYAPRISETGAKFATGTPAIAVPILMYHGITSKPDGINTTLDNFINQMEVLKEGGYETITIRQYEEFRNGLFTLPPNPIILTFDDGRKDSYYPVDSILKELGYTATIFLASGPTLSGNDFYLTFEELKKMHDTGRWDIQAHGRLSHEHIDTGPDPAAEKGRYLSSRIYLPDFGRIETEEEFRVRITEDYKNGIADVAALTGERPRYLAVPLNDYGTKPFSNYPKAYTVNKEVMRSIFALAFTQVNDLEDLSKIVRSPYNFSFTDPYDTARLEVGSMTAKQLLKILNDYRPLQRDLDLADLISVDKGKISGVFGFDLAVNPPHLFSAEEAGDAAMALMGENFYKSYTVRSRIWRNITRSIGIVVNAEDVKHYISCGLTDRGFFLRSYTDGVYTDLVPSLIDEKLSALAVFDFSVVSKDGQVSCYMDGHDLFGPVNVPYTHGQVGIKIWDDAKIAQVYIDNFNLNSYAN